MNRALPADIFLLELALNSDAILIDVRTSDEIRSDGLIEGATHLDYLEARFEARLEAFDKFHPYFLYDDGGQRAPLACTLMEAHGFLQVYYLEGGKQAFDQSFETL